MAVAQVSLLPANDVALRQLCAAALPDRGPCPLAEFGPNNIVVLDDEQWHALDEPAFAVLESADDANGVEGTGGVRRTTCRIIMVPAAVRHAYLMSCAASFPHASVFRDDAFDTVISSQIVIEQLALAHMHPPPVERYCMLVPFFTDPAIADEVLFTVFETTNPTIAYNVIESNAANAISKAVGEALADAVGRGRTVVAGERIVCTGRDGERYLVGVSDTQPSMIAVQLCDRTLTSFEVLVPNFGTSPHSSWRSTASPVFSGAASPSQKGEGFGAAHRSPSFTPRRKSMGTSVSPQRLTHLTSPTAIARFDEPSASPSRTRAAHEGLHGRSKAKEPASPRAAGFTVIDFEATDAVPLVASSASEPRSSKITQDPRIFDESLPKLESASPVRFSPSGPSPRPPQLDNRNCDNRRDEFDHVVVTSPSSLIPTPQDGSPAHPGAPIAQSPRFNTLGSHEGRVPQPPSPAALVEFATRMVALRRECSAVGPRAPTSEGHALVALQRVKDLAMSLMRAHNDVVSVLKPANDLRVPPAQTFLSRESAIILVGFPQDKISLHSVTLCLERRGVSVSWSFRSHTGSLYFCFSSSSHDAAVRLVSRGASEIALDLGLRLQSDWAIAMMKHSVLDDLCRVCEVELKAVLAAMRDVRHNVAFDFLLGPFFSSLMTMEGELRKALVAAHASPRPVNHGAWDFATTNVLLRALQDVEACAASNVPSESRIGAAAAALTSAAERCATAMPLAVKSDVSSEVEALQAFHRRVGVALETLDSVGWLYEVLLTHGLHERLLAELCIASEDIGLRGSATSKGGWPLLNAFLSATRGIDNVSKETRTHEILLGISDPSQADTKRRVQEATARASLSERLTSGSVPLRRLQDVDVFPLPQHL